MGRFAPVLILVALLAAACGRGRGTPESTFETVRAAVTSRDDRLLYEVHSSDGRAWARQCAREWRALLDRGDAPESFLGDTGMTEADLRDGDLEELAGRVLRGGSPLVAQAEWYAQARLQTDAIRYEGPDAACLVLKGMDGQESELWLVREDGLWGVDAGRTWRLK